MQRWQLSWRAIEMFGEQRWSFRLMPTGHSDRGDQAHWPTRSIGVHYRAFIACKWLCLATCCGSYWVSNAGFQRRIWLHLVESFGAAPLNILDWDFLCLIELLRMCFLDICTESHRESECSVRRGQLNSSSNDACYCPGQRALGRSRHQVKHA